MIRKRALVIFLMLAIAYPATVLAQRASDIVNCLPTATAYVGRCGIARTQQ